MEFFLKNQKISTEKLNFIIAVCAILISAASFYATYLQADAANKQVKAMTLPLLQFSTGNWSPVLKKKQITFTLRNAGAGAAIIKDYRFIYKGNKYHSLDSYLKACCAKETDEFLQKIKNTNDTSLLTSRVINTVLAGQEENEFLMLTYADNNQPLWNKLNNERWKTKIEVCFCSLLDNCYVTQENNPAKPVEQCL